MLTVVRLNDSASCKLRHLLLLDNEEGVPFRAAFLQSAMVSVHKLRGPASQLAWDQRGKYIRANFKELVSSVPSLRIDFNGIWCASGLRL